MDTPTTSENGLRARLRDWTLIALFCAGLGVPAVRTVAAPESRAPEREWRPPIPFPERAANLRTLAAFPRGFDEWMNDHFAFRARLLLAHSWVKYYWFHVAPAGPIAVGRDGWIFLDGVDHRETARRMHPFTEEDLARWQALLERRQRFLAERGIRYVVAIAPEKGTIYPEYLPPNWTRVHERSRYDQLVEHMRAHSDVALLDLRPALRAAREQGLVYYPLGSHWNEMGSYVGYREIMARVAEWFPEAAPKNLDDFDIVTSEEQGDTWAEKLYLDRILVQTCIALRPKQLVTPIEARIEGLKGYNVRLVSDVPTELRGVMFRDSFATTLIPFFTPHFRCLSVFWRPELLPEQLLIERPRVLIQEFAERDLASWSWRFDHEWSGGADAAQAGGLVRDQG